MLSSTSGIAMVRLEISVVSSFPKYHRTIIYGGLNVEIGKILRELCRRKEVEIIEGHAKLDYIHILVNIPSKESVSYCVFAA